VTDGERDRIGQVRRSSSWMLRNLDFDEIMLWIMFILSVETNFVDVEFFAHR
jgi:hypothetical protein